jgi:alcohol dehydrogenase YqhD (iron-dependent ADH family)
MVAHNNCCGVGRDQDWSSHCIEHELSALYDCAHGAGLSAVFPAWMEHTLDHDVMRFAQVASRVWGCPMDFQNPEVTARAGIQAFRNFLKSIGMPQTMAELGGKEEDIPYMAHTACFGNGNGGTIGGFVELHEEDVAAIYRRML